ncbi:MAG: outer membrane lipoprotein-sorting protein [bacterium]
MSWISRLGISGLLFGMFWAGAVPLMAQDAREIMQQVRDREDGRTEVSRMKLVTCRTIKRDGRLVCAEEPRIKLFESVRKDYGTDEQDSRSVMIIREPADERGIGFLQYDHSEQGQDSDQWMYLAALNKVKRIVAGSPDEPKTGSFFGSEIGYEDLENRHLDDYVYRIVKEETWQQRPCWIIESRPVPERSSRSNYSRSIQWVDQERLLNLKTLLYDRQGQPLKQILATQVEQQEGIWVTRQLHVFNVQTRRQTSMVIEALALNVEVADEFLTQRALTDAAFREGTLQQLTRQLR